MENFLNYINKNRYKILVASICTIFSFLISFNVNLNVFGNLDASWIYKMNLDIVQRAQFGVDRIFTYGPLTNIVIPIMIEGTNLLSVFITRFLIVLFNYWLLLKIVQANKGSLKEFVLIVIPISFIYLTILNNLINVTCFFTVYLLFYETITAKESNFHECFYVISLGLMALSTLIKFMGFLFSVSLIVILASAIIYKKQYKRLLYFLLYPLFLILLWLRLGQKIANFDDFFVNSFEVAKGYTEAMSHFGIVEFFVGILYGILFLIPFNEIISNNIKNKKFLNGSSLFFIISLPFWFLIFKHGFVRNDTHIFSFISIGCVLTLINFYIFSKEQKVARMSYKHIVLFYILFLSVGSMGIHMFPDIFKNSIDNSKKIYIQSFANRETKEKIYSANKKQIRDFYNLSKKTQAELKGKSVDIFPFDLAMHYGYDFKLLSRPVFQSYSVYTTKLDNINAQHFKKNPPQLLLYSYKAIDGRYPLFDEPNTFLYILNNYSFSGKDGEFLILKRNKVQKNYKLKQIKTVVGKLNEEIFVPKSKNLVIANIKIKHTSFGKLLNIFFKTEDLMIYFNLNSGEQVIKKAIRPNLKNNIIISDFADNNNDLIKLILNKNTDKKIKSFFIKSTWITHGRQIEKLLFSFKKNYEIDFYELI